MYVSSSTPSSVAVLPSTRTTLGLPSGGPAVSSAGGPAGIGWLGMSSRTCWNPQRL